MSCKKVYTMRYGRIRIRSGDGTPLDKTVPFDDGNLEVTTSKTREPVIVRGILRDAVPGADVPASWTFSAFLRDRTLRRTMDQMVWDAQAEALTGLTPQAVNTVTLDYAYEQGSLGPASGETGMPTKLAAGATPTGDGEYAEATGAEDSEGVTVVSAADGLKVQPNAADTDLDIVYDAVGATTQFGGCDPSVKTFQLILEKLDPLNPATVLESYILDNAYTTEVGQAEAETGDKQTFSGSALNTRLRIIDGAVS